MVCPILATPDPRQGVQLLFIDGGRNASHGRVAGARHFRELVCWQLSYKLKLGIYQFAELPQVRRDVKFYDRTNTCKQ
jgi:hypothetical protein